MKAMRFCVFLLICQGAWAQPSDRAEWVNEVLYQARAGNGESAISILNQSVLTGQIPAEAAEKGLFHLAHALHQEKANNAFLQVVEFLQQYQPKVTVAHPESRGSYQIPKYNIGPAALGATRIWTRQAMKQETLEAFSKRKGEDLILNASLAERSVAEVGGIKDAIAEIDPKILAGLRDRFYALSSSRPGGEVALAASKRLADHQLTLHIITHAPSDISARALNSALEIYNDKQTQALWLASAKSERPEIASTALTALGKHYAHQSNIRATLVDRLNDRKLGSSAALGLAKSSDPSAVQALDRVLNQTDSSISAKRNAALALKVNNSPAARSALSRFAEHTSEQSLQQEVQQWLR